MGYIGHSIIYYIVFIICGTLFSAADRAISDKKTKRWIFLGIMLLSAFAGLRNISVGTDTANVVHYRFDNARLYSSWRSILTPGNEPFLTLIGWIIRKNINDYRAYLFVLQLLLEIPVSIIAYKLRKEVNIAGVMTVFMLMFFQVSLNIHKQTIAAAWLLLAVIYFREKNYAKAIIVAAFATLFHGSVFMGVALFAIIYILSTSKSYTVRLIVILLAAGAAVILFFNWRSFANIILSSERLANDYTGYLSIMAGETGQRYTSFHYRTYISIVLRTIGIIVIVATYMRSERRFDSNTRFYMYCTGVGYLIYSLFVIAFHMYIGDRFTLYLDICQIILIPMLVGKSDSMRYSNRKALTVRIHTSGPYIVYYFYLVYNFAYHMIVNYGKTLPYQIG